MKTIPFNFDWERVRRGEREALVNIDEPVKVDLPDDSVIDTKRNPEAVGGAFTGYFEGGQAAYTKKFSLPEEWEDKTVLLYVDGAYMNSNIVMNTEIIEYHPYGYTPFYADLTPWLKKENVLKIETQNRQPNTRWYAGGGLYRQVMIWLGDTYYIHPWSVFVTTPQVNKECAHVRAEFEVTSSAKTNAWISVQAEILYQGEAVSCQEISFQALAGKATREVMELVIENPVLWDTETPELYQLRLTVIGDEKVMDIQEQNFGVRKIEMDSKNGMRINGRPIKLRGGCIHHDHGALGAAAYPAAEERKLRILKEQGYNAVRTSHNPPSSTFLDLCDQMGILVLEESFDCWLKEKTGNDYHVYFRDWWERDLRAMVLRDRNHPCVFAWSIGNEIDDVAGSEEGLCMTKRQADYVRSLDHTRPVTIGQHGVINFERAGIDIKADFAKLQAEESKVPGVIGGKDYWALQTERHFAQLDLAGYNYMWPRYATDAVKYPERVIVATETLPSTMYDYWKAVLNNKNCIGDFIWTAYNNIGEAGSGRVIWDMEDPKEKGFLGAYPWLSNGQGDMDLDGNRRPQSYYHGILWGLDKGIHLFTTHPSHTGKPFGGTGWHWPELYQEWTFADEYVGKPVKLDAYADCDEVEFRINDKSLGRVKPERYIASLEIPYEKGTLIAIAYQDGEEIARDSLETTGKPAEIKIIPEKKQVAADGMDLAYVRIEIRDADGRLVTAHAVEVSVEVSGAGKLAGLGSGNPCTEENYGTGKRQTWNGSVLAAIRAAKTAGDIVISVAADGMDRVEEHILCNE